MSTVRSTSLPTACVAASITLKVPGYAGIIYGIAFVGGLAWLVLRSDKLDLYRTYRQFRWFAGLGLAIVGVAV